MQLWQIVRNIACFLMFISYISTAWAIVHMELANSAVDRHQSTARKIIPTVGTKNQLDD